MISALAAAALLAGAAPDPNAELLAGKMPDEPARAVVQGKCLLCHSADYVTQQRLTPAQWQKTVEKMRKFGAPLTDDEVKQVSEYLSKHWTVDLPERRPPPAPPPRSAAPSR